ncbi:rhamnose-binding lectin-like isoform X2 [Hydractinia symbiolongicarpus]|uniref:rhamnose-binding lectin-like isoform X2 n=1 Tax=Hydractinia symbiolongicarpus TaxID=13093 RepID=UPI00254BA981|nr:rhamnose-binding lectin-like isoform X2 [Hydractinia symbiolongicarpus]
MKILASVIGLLFISHVTSGFIPRRGIACEHRTLGISCPFGTTITVLSANYGRLSKHVCRGTNSHLTTTCKASSSLKKVRASCNGKRSCKVSASNGVFGDPCVGVFKYLTVNFVCRPIPPRNVACEHKALNVRCPAGTVIRITYANYGRLSKSICPGVNSHRTCRASSSFHKVRAACNGRRFCSVAASNRVFGDPCHGVYKYLIVRHTCVRPTPPRNVACEHRALNVRCPVGTVIRITYANYGRLSRHICPGVNSHRTCSASSSFHKVRAACNGRRSCSIAASNRVFGDPCHGAYKYLIVRHTCVRPTPPQSIACEHKTLNLRCPTGTAIRITYANYGRLSTSICPGVNSHRTTTCRASSSFAKVSAACNGKRSCSIGASNRVFGDPCYGVYKYLAVRHSCVRVPTRRRLVCEHRNLALSCPAGLKLRITFANYGRLSRGICPGSNSHRTTTCTASSSVGKVAHACNGKHSCSIAASNRVFGDPCRGVFKYLIVKYQCA